MKARFLLAASLSTVLLAACGGSSDDNRAVPVPPAPPVTGVITARFDPAASPSVLPSAINLAFQGTTDLTLNPPVADPNNFGDPAVAISTLDGFGTVTPITTTFSSAPNPSTLTPGSGVRVFEVTLSGPGGGVTGVTRELTPQEFTVAPVATDASGRTIAIVPLQPLKQVTSYLVVLTDVVRDAQGNPATPDQTYFFTQSADPLCVGGQSQIPALTNAQACALEPLRLLTNSQEAAAAAAGVSRSSIALSWTFTTQSVSPVMQAVRENVEPVAVTLAPSGFTIGDVLPVPPVADIIVGAMNLPYYLDAAESPNDPTPLQTFWQANPGAYVPPFNQFGLDPTSTNLTYANPEPRQKDTVRIPVLVTVPNANSGQTQPADGWPVVIYQHGITRNRSDALALAAGFAAQGYAVVAIDLPLHGIWNPNSPEFPLYAEGPLVGALGAQERHFNLDLDGQPGIDSSGAYFINLSSLLTSRDNIRQGIADLFTLAVSIDDMTVGGVINFDGSNVSFVGQSLGGIVGTSFVSLEPTVGVGVISVAGGGIAQLLNGSATFGPVIRAGLAEVGVQPGTPQFAQFLGAAQTVIDSADPVNIAAFSAGNAFLLHEVVGGDTLSGDVVNLPDQVVPNSVPGAPLSGTEPLIRALGLASITQAGVFTNEGQAVRAAVRFTQGEHGSLLSPARSEALHPPGSPNGFIAVTTEMQTQAGSFIVSGGTAVVVTDEDVIRTE